MAKNSNDILKYLNDANAKRNTAVRRSYNKQFQNINKMKTGGEQCGGVGKPRCFKKFGSRVNWGNVGKVALGALGLTAAGLGIKKLIDNNKSNSGNSRGGGNNNGSPGFLENMFGGN